MSSVAPAPALSSPLPAMRLFLIFLGFGFASLLAALDLGDPAAAEPELEALVAEWQAAREKDPSPGNATGLATSLHALGVIRRQLGDPERAAADLRRACELLENHHPPLLADAREALALTLQDLGRFSESEELLSRVLSTRRARPGDPVALALTLDHLAQSLLLQGRYPEVASLLEESLSLLPPQHPTERARVIGHLGRLHHTLGSHARALQRFDQALELDFSDPDLRLALRSQRALALLRLGKNREAVEATTAVADDACRSFAATPIRAVAYINNLGALHLALGQPEEAIPRFGEARDLILAHLGERHPALAGACHNLGVALQQAGDLDAARTELTAAAELQREFLPDDHLRVAECRRDLAVTAILSRSPDATRLAREATTRGLRLLDRLVESGSETERLNFIERFDLLALPCALGDAELIADTLLASKARLLEVMIGGDDPRHFAWRELSSALPPGTAFIDFCRYRPLAPESIDRFGAILIVAGRSPEWIELESIDHLQRWLGAMRRRLDWNAARLAGESHPPPALTLAGALRALDQQFWAPIEARIPPEVRHLVVAPDGAAHFLPLPVLIDSRQRLLCHRFDQVTRVASGRDLLDRRPLPPLDGSPWTVLTLSEYPHGISDDATENPLLRVFNRLGPLPGAAEEEGMIRKLAPPRSTFLQNADVSEAVLPGLPPGPAVLHFSGHAFFLDTDRPDHALPLDFDLHADRLSASGLILHQGLAQTDPTPAENPGDDLLFPAEIARLPLEDTRLVTLSSCESGIGTSVNGEGVLGLQRAFAIAGARETLVALWPISDRSTPGFMRRFYQLALRSDRTAQALWQAQAEHLPSPDDPAFEEAVLRFAPFTLSQNHPPRPGPPILDAPRKPFRWEVLLAILPALLFLFARWARPQPKTLKIMNF